MSTKNSEINKSMVPSWAEKYIGKFVHCMEFSSVYDIVYIHSVSVKQNTSLDDKCECCYFNVYDSVGNMCIKRIDRKHIVIADRTEYLEAIKVRYDNKISALEIEMNRKREMAKMHSEVEQRRILHLLSTGKIC